jgi:hypothetical protein
LFSGIDLHKRSVAFHTVDAAGSVVRRANLPAHRRALRACFGALPGPHSAVVECTGEHPGDHSGGQPPRRPPSYSSSNPHRFPGGSGPDLPVSCASLSS